MGRTSDFSNLKGLAIIEWNIQTATLLCIKSGTTSLWAQAASRDGKMRQVDASFDFFVKSNETEASLSDFYHDTCFENGRLQIRYCIPSSSFRGALRSYTIKRLVPKSSWNATDISKQAENEDHTQAQEQERQRMKAALTLPGWHLIQNLFGIATDSGDAELYAETVAGRLRVSVGKLEKLPEEDFKRNLLAGNLTVFNTGSTHGKMVITTRNPLDRITQAAKDGGLHSFMELAPGNEFNVTLHIVNPSPEDLGMVAFWEQGIKTGLLRLGGLTSIGRGRLNINLSHVSIFTRTPEAFFGLKPDNRNASDMLIGIFNEYVVDDWGTKKQDYLNKLRAFYHDFKKEE